MTVGVEVLAELLALVEDLERFEDVAIQRPLSIWRAWDRPEPRTSQKRALQLVALYRVVFVFGGNRSGKTELLRAVLVALVIGSDHPDARAFWLAHDVDPNVFPRGPGHGWIVAIRVADSITYHRQQVLSLIPKWGPAHPASEEGNSWYAWGMMGTGEARLQVMCPGYAEPAEILFKSDDPGPDTMQGAGKVRAILHDEETRRWGNATWEECGIRLIDLKGWHLMSNTPTRGRTWLWEEHVNNRQPDEGVTWIHAPDNPYLPPSELKKLERDPATAAIRLRGEFVALEGRVWPAFSRATHVVPPFEIPDGSPLFRGIDFGTRHPFCCLWSVVLRRQVTLSDGRTLPDGALVFYREHYQREWTLHQHVARMRTLENGESIEATWCDPEDPQQMLQLAHTYDMEVHRALKAVTAGIAVVADMMAPGHDGRPGLYVVETCVNTIREVENYCWGERGESERPVGQDDHACDPIRYTAMGVRSYLA